MSVTNKSILFWGPELVLSPDFQSKISQELPKNEVLYRDDSFEIQNSLLSPFHLVVLELTGSFNPIQELFKVWGNIPVLIIVKNKDQALLEDILKLPVLDFMLADPEGGYLKLVPLVLQRCLRHVGPRFSIHNDQIQDQIPKNEPSDSQRAEIDFKQLYSLLRTMTDTVPDMIWAKDLNGRYIYTNTSTCQNLLNALNTHEPIGKDVMAFVRRERELHSGDPNWYTYGEKCIETDKETLARGKMCRFTDSGFIMGTSIILDIYKAPLVDDAGELIGTVGTARDITLQEETRERYRKLFDFSPDPVVVHVDGIVIAANQAAAEFIGAERPEDHIGSSIFKFVHADYRQRTKLQVKGSSRLAKPPGTVEEKYLTLDGTARDVETISVPIKYGNQNAWMVTFRDITERKLASEQVQRSLREKEALLQEIYHRTRNNMQVVSAIINIRSRDVTDPASNQMFKEIRDRIAAMSLAHDQLYEAKDLSAIDFTQYLQNLSNHLSQSYAGTALRAPIHIKAESLVISIDQAVPLGLVINEILTNAYKYAFPDDRKGKIHLELTHSSANQLDITIRDNGIGLPVDLFNDSLSTIIITGLVTDQLGGSVDYDGQNGTRFRISIPNKEIVRRI